MFRVVYEYNGHWIGDPHTYTDFADIETNPPIFMNVAVIDPQSKRVVATFGNIDPDTVPTEFTPRGMEVVETVRSTVKVLIPKGDDDELALGQVLAEALDEGLADLLDPATQAVEERYVDGFAR